MRICISNLVSAQCCLLSAALLPGQKTAINTYSACTFHELSHIRLPVSRVGRSRHDDTNKHKGKEPHFFFFRKRREKEVDFKPRRRAVPHPCTRMLKINQQRASRTRCIPLREHSEPAAGGKSKTQIKITAKFRQPGGQPGGSQSAANPCCGRARRNVPYVCVCMYASTHIPPLRDAC